jgi:hypothetical protein
MLVRFTDRKGKVCWVNPVHVRAVRPHKGGTAIVLPVSGLEGSVEVRLPVDDVARMLNAGMPICAAALPPDDEPGTDEGDGAMGGLGPAIGLLG